MGQVTGIIVVMLLIIFIFVPLAILDANDLEVTDIKQSISLSARVLDGALGKDATETAKVADGYTAVPEDEVIIDRDRLITDFYHALFLNLPSEKRFQEVKGSLAAKVLVYGDRFFVAGACRKDMPEQWSAPYFFTIYSGAYGDIYLSIKSDRAYYYQGSEKEYVDMNDLGISTEEKNDVIVNKLNAVIARYTKEAGIRNGLGIEIGNPSRQSFFNVLEGTTFFVVFAEDKLLNLYSKGFHYKNYSVTGYTIYQ